MFSLGPAKIFHFNVYHCNENFSLIQQKSISLRKNMIIINNICKKSNTYFTKSVTSCAREEMGERPDLRRIVNVCKLRGTTRMHTVFCGSNPMNKAPKTETHRRTQQQPKRSGQTTHSTLQPQNSIT